MKVLAVIDPKSKNIRIVSAPKEEQSFLDRLYEIIDCSCVDCIGGLGEVAINSKLYNIALWIDDEGLYKDTKSFKLQNAEDPNLLYIIKGKAVVAISDDEGESYGFDNFWLEDVLTIAFKKNGLLLFEKD